MFGPAKDDADADMAVRHGSAPAAAAAAASPSDAVEDDSTRANADSKRINSLPTQCVHVLVAPNDIATKKVEKGVLCVRFNTEGDYIMSGGRDRTPRLWNPHKGTHLQAYAGIHGYEVTDIAITRDNKKFASVGGDKLAFVWDVEHAQVIKRYRGHTERINAVCFSGDFDAAEPNSVLCTGSYDKTVKLWDNRSRLVDAILSLSEFTDSVTSVAMTDHLIVTGCVDGRLRTFDIRNGKRVVDHVLQPITHVALSHDRQCVLVSTLDSALRLFDLSTGELLNRYGGHKNVSYKVDAQLTHTDAHVVSGSEDHALWLWSLVEAKPVRQLRGHTRDVLSVACHPSNAACIVSASTDGTVRVWK